MYLGVSSIVDLLLIAFGILVVLRAEFSSWPPLPWLKLNQQQLRKVRILIGGCIIVAGVALLIVDLLKITRRWIASSAVNPSLLQAKALPPSEMQGLLFGLAVMIAAVLQILLAERIVELIFGPSGKSFNKWAAIIVAALAFVVAALFAVLPAMVKLLN